MRASPEPTAAAATGTPPAAAERPPDGVRTRLAVFAIVALMIALPAFAARRPPIWDLAPQMDQARLFFATLADADSPLRIAWLAPNRICYPLLAAGWLTGGARWGPRLGLALCLIAVAGAIHLLAARTRRPVESAVAASVFVFSSAVYGGFFNFAIGGVALALLVAGRNAAEDAPAERPRAAARALALGALLYFSHVLWLAFGAALLALDFAARPERRRAAAVRLAGLAPFLLAAVFWLVTQAGPLWSHTVVFRYHRLERLLEPEFLAGRVLGGLRGTLEPLAAGAVVLWCGAGAWAARRAARAAAVDRELVRLALLLVGAGLLLPAAVGETAQMGSRWLPWAAVCAVLAAPAPEAGRRLRLALAGALLAAFVAATAATWTRLERTELAGFEAALAGVPSGAPLLGLDFEPVSPALRVSPWPNLYHYAALERGAELAASYTRVASSLVRARASGAPAWNDNLRPRVRGLPRGRLRPFPFALVHARPHAQEQFGARFPAFRRRAGQGDWVLWENAGKPARRPLSSVVARPDPPGAGSR